jgi:hypothetical protein
MGWIIDANIPFYGIEHPLFRELLLVLNRDFINELLPESADTVKNWITMEYETRKTLLKREFQVARSKIHITFDLWTSPNNTSQLDEELPVVTLGSPFYPASPSAGTSVDLTAKPESTLSIRRRKPYPLAVDFFGGDS